MTTLELIDTLDSILDKVYDFITIRGMYHHEVRNLIGSHYWWNKLDEDQRIAQMRLMKSLSDIKSAVETNCRGYLSSAELKHVSQFLLLVESIVSAQDKQATNASSTEQMVEHIKKEYGHIKPMLELVSKAEQ